MPFQSSTASRQRGCGVRGVASCCVSFAIALLLAGCVLPIPTPEHKVLEGVPVTAEQLDFVARGVEPNVTTRDEVLARLGTPSVIWEDARVYAYRWDMRQGVLVWAVAGAGAGAGVSPAGFGRTDIPRHHLVLVQLDAQDRVVRAEHVTRPLTQTYGDFLKRWAGIAMPAHASNAVVLMRLQCLVAGQPRPVFPNDPYQWLFLTRLGDFASIGAPKFAAQSVVSDASAHDGWIYFERPPGVYYLSVDGPRTGAPFFYQSASGAGTREPIDRAPRWRIDVSEGGRVIYVGTLQYDGSPEPRDPKRIYPTDGVDGRLVDEHDLASLLAEHGLAEKGEVQTALMTRWQPGKPLVFRTQ